MSYESTRISEQLRVLEPAIADFIVRYNLNTLIGPAGGGQRQTVFLFPGGMASRLMRAKTAYSVDGEVFDYDEAWINPSTFLGDGRHLKMTRVGSTYRDKWNKIIVADGLINLFGVTPYVVFTLWCTLKRLDYFVFPWDWRRSVSEVSDFFVTTFLPFFRGLVQAGCNNADPLQRFSLIGHSAGGMVVNWTLRSGDGILAGLDQVITVATPFYGYAGQLHRWFEGEDYLNGIGNAFRPDIIRAICSFPGCYAWMFLPQTTFWANQAALTGDLNYPLAGYPSVDADNAAVVADPYNPQTLGPLQRYPSATSSGFDSVELASAQIIVNQLSSPLGTKANQFWNIRGDTLAGNTPNTTTWKWVPPTDPSPIIDATFAAGDGVQPGWTSRHVELDGLGRVITIQKPAAAHAILMDVPETIAAIAGILGIPFP